MINFGYVPCGKEALVERNIHVERLRERIVLRFSRFCWPKKPGLLEWEFREATVLCGSDRDHRSMSAASCF